VIPEVGERAPETGFSGLVSTRKLERFGRKINKNKNNLATGNVHRIGPPRALSKKRGRIPIDDFHKSASEGEGACSRTSAGRSHLPLRGKLGWMTPRPGQKKAGKRNAS